MTRTPHTSADGHEAIVPMPPVATFRPALVPEGARTHVLEAITLVRRFISSFFSVGMLLAALVGILLGWVPAQVTEFGMLVQGLLAIVFVAFFATIFFVFNVKRIDGIFRTQRLADLCRGDAGSAALLAFDIASDASTATLGAALRLMSAAKATGSSDAIDAIVPAEAGPSSAVDESLTSAEDNKHKTPSPTISESSHILNEEQPLLGGAPKRLLELVEDELPPEFRAAAAEETLANVKNKMESSPLYIFERTIRLLLKDTLYAVILAPLACLSAGYVLCSFNVKVNGKEIILIGFLLGSFGPMLWYVVRERALAHLAHARERLNDPRIEKARQQTTRVPRGQM